MSLIVAMVNGRVTDRVDIADRGFAYGDGLFETMAVVNQQIPLLEYHLRRLSRGLSALSIVLEPSLIDTYLLLLQPYFAQQKSSFVCKLTVTRGQGGRGYQASQSQVEACRPQVYIQLFSSPAFEQSSGVSVHTCQTLLGHQPHLAGIKTLSALTYVLAANERIDTDFDEGLLFDHAGYLIEASARNIFIIDSDGKLLTPLLNHCGVRGVMRDWLINKVINDNITDVIEQPINKQQLLEAQEVFLTNSVTGIWPVLSWYDNRQSDLATSQWSLGPITQQLMTQTGLLFS